MLTELQADYQAKLHGLFDEQYTLNYWVDYAEGERVILCDGVESPGSPLE